jgi:hypothetical protein
MRQTPLAVLLLIILISSPIMAMSGVSGERTRTTPVADSSLRSSLMAPDDMAQRAPPDPATDTLGWESGYWYNESIDIDGTDGLSRSELDAFLGRSMARVERIRHLEFTEPVRIEFVRREELNVPRNDTYGLPTSEQLWEALFIFGENDAPNAVRRAQLSVVLGYAAEEGSDHIVIVDSSPEQPTVSGGTLIHELAHMLQDQHFNLSRPRYQRHTLDGEFAKDGLVEGGASYITALYRKNCQNTWQCVEAPSRGSSVERPAPPRFYRLTYFPYTAGERYVRALIEQGGWKAVTAAHESPPVSTEQVIHTERNNRAQPIPISFTDTSRNGWTRVDERPETIGEAGINTLFWRRLDSVTGRYDYTSRPSSGWGNDRLYAYANGNTHGYVWKTVWDTKRDAREFRNAYVTVLKAEGATQKGPHTWKIEDGAFTDAFSVRRTGNTVTIVNGPTTAALNDIHSVKKSKTRSHTPHTNRNTGQTTTTTATTTTTGPGFGGLVALAAIVLAVIGLYNRE